MYSNNGNTIVIIVKRVILVILGTVIPSRYHHRFIARFPIGLDFPLITLPYQEC